MTRWIQKAAPKPGALHRQLGYPVSEKIPVAVLKRIKILPVGRRIHGHTITPKMKKRVQFALNVR